MHIAHRLDVAFLAISQLLLQHIELDAQLFYFLIKITDVMANRIYGTTLTSNLRIQHHQVLQTFLHILLRRSQFTFLFLDLLLYLFTLFL